MTKTKKKPKYVGFATMRLIDPKRHALISKKAGFRSWVSGNHCHWTPEQAKANARAGGLARQARRRLLTGTD
jgi:hypothetical protein